MLRNEFLEIIKKYPYLANKFNNSTKMVVFPSSFGVCPTKTFSWLFYEVDERCNCFKRMFKTENEAYTFALKYYNVIYTRPQVSEVLHSKAIENLDNSAIFDGYYNSRRYSSPRAIKHCKASLRKHHKKRQ